MARLTLTESKATAHARHLDFLKDAFRQIANGDDMPRMIFTAMKYRLGWYQVHAAVNLGIIRKEGWRWKWTGARPSDGMVTALREEVAERMRRGMTTPLAFRHKARKRYAQLMGAPIVTRTRA